MTNVDIALTCSGFRAAHSLWYSRMGSIKVLKTSAFVAVVTVLLSNMCFRNLPNARLAVSTLVVVVVVVNLLLSPGVCALADALPFGV